MILSLFYILLCQLYIFLCKESVQIFCPHFIIFLFFFFFSLTILERSLYIVDELLIRYEIPNIILWFVTLVFFLLTVSFLRQRFYFNFDKLNCLCIFDSIHLKNMYWTFNITSKNASPKPWSHIFSPLFSSKSSRVLHITIWSMAHIELIFLYSVKCVLSFIFRIWAHKCSRIFYWKDYPFSIELPLHLCLTLNQSTF